LTNVYVGAQGGTSPADLIEPVRSLTGSIGFEDAGELIADVNQALAVIS
jgi:hypothetical protein